MGELSKEAQETLAGETAIARNRPLKLPRSVDNSKVIGDIDADIAKRLRAIRIKAGLSQTILGQRVGVSYQQMQKYEHGRDRIAASTIQRFADALGVQAGWFFERTKVPYGDIPTVTENLKIAKLVQSVTDDQVRRRLIDLVTALSGEGTAGPKLVQRRLMALADCIAGLPVPGGEI